MLGDAFLAIQVMVKMSSSSDDWRSKDCE